jgi:hypothetical protein
MKYSYYACGLVIRSTVPLPELVEIEGVADAVIRLGRLITGTSEAVIEDNDFCVTKQSTFLFWKDVGTLQVKGGHEIIVDPTPGVDERVLRLCILGPGLAVLLHQRGQLPLHAATVEIDGSAVAFMGGPGCGKSALAAAFYKRGYRIVADDITAVLSNGVNAPAAFPGFPQLKLWPEVIVFLGDNPEKLPRVEFGIDKRAFPVTRGFSLRPFSLRRIYILSEDQREEIIPLRPQEAMVELIRHSYRAPLLKWIGAKHHFSQCAFLVNNVPISRLSRPLSLSALPDVARMVEEDLAHV